MTALNAYLSEWGPSASPQLVHLRVPDAPIEVEGDHRGQGASGRGRHAHEGEDQHGRLTVAGEKEHPLAHYGLEIVAITSMH